MKKKNLTTTAKTDLVAAINEVDGNIGDLSGLTTTAKTNLVSAVNELNQNMGTPIPINISNTFGTTESPSRYQITGNICVFAIVFRNSNEEIAPGASFLSLPFSTVLNQTPILVYDATDNKNVYAVALDNGEIVSKESIPINHSLRISGAFIIS